MKSIEEIHIAIFGANEDDEELTTLQDELKRTKKQLEIANAELDYIKEQIEKNSVFDNTRKALDVAKLILKNLLPTLDGYERLDVEKAIAKITALEQKE